MCGQYVEIPHNIAKKVMKPNGTIISHDEVLCMECQDWWAWNVDYDCEQQYLLPSPR
jgi:hypothetical protein